MSTSKHDQNATHSADKVFPKSKHFEVFCFTLKLFYFSFVVIVIFGRKSKLKIRIVEDLYRVKYITNAHHKFITQRFIFFKGIWGLHKKGWLLVAIEH